MPRFEITKPLLATLVVDCASREEAELWANKIVVSMEDENGEQVEDGYVYFEADASVREMRIEEVEE